METIFHDLHGASYIGKIDLSNAYYQIELDEEAKDICTINTSQGLFKMFRLPQRLKNASSIFQNCIDSTLKGIKGVVIFQDYVLVYETTKKQFDRRMLAQSRADYMRKILLLMRKGRNQKQSIALVYLGYSISIEGIAADSKHVVIIKNAKAPTNNKQLE